jgi:hypothetical protein
VEETAVRIEPARSKPPRHPRQDGDYGGDQQGDKPVDHPEEDSAEVFASMMISRGRGARSSLSNDAFFFSNVTSPPATMSSRRESTPLLSPAGRTSPLRALSRNGLGTSRPRQRGR